MVNLVATTDTLEIVLGEAKTTTDCDIVASYADVSAGSFQLGENDLVSNGTTFVTVVAAPIADVQRQVKEITLHNNDTVSHVVTLRLNNNGTRRIIRQTTVASGADFIYTPDLTTATGGTVTNIATTFGITGGPITNTGTLTSTGSALNTQSGDYTVTNADVGKYIVMTKSTAATLTLTAASLTTGWWAIVTQALTGTTAANKVMTYTVTTGLFDGAASGVDYPGAQRLIEFDGTNFNTVLLKGGLIEIFTSDTGFSATKPTGCTEHTFFGVGCGGAGGSGRRGAAGTARGGGTAGGGGRSNWFTSPDTYISSPIVFTVPTGPNGGAAQTVDNTDGNPGSAAAANLTIVTGGRTLISCGAGGPGAGGQAATALSGGAGAGLTAGAAGGAAISQGGQPTMDVATVSQGQFGGANGLLSVGGSASGQGGASGAGATNLGGVGLTGGAGLAGGGEGGGAGGGISATNAASAGGNAGRGGPVGSSAGGAAGTSGVAGGNGGVAPTSPSAAGHECGGGGGGSGFDNSGGGTASVGGNGAAGGIGSGGGGGGASLNGNNSGGGGKGGDALARWWYN